MLHGAGVSTITQNQGGTVNNMANKNDANEFNVIFIEKDGVYFFGFPEIKRAAGFSFSHEGMYIVPVESITGPMLSFKINKHMSLDTKLIDFLTSKRALNYHFIYSPEDGRYYQSRISVSHSDVDFYLKFPECKAEDFSNDEK